MRVLVFESHAAVRFEVRLAQHDAESGLRQASIQDSSRSVYLHEEVLVSNGDIAAAAVIPGNAPGEFWVSLEFTEHGANKMRIATEAHLGKPIALLVDDQVVVAPVIKAAVGASAVISGRYTRSRPKESSTGSTDGL